MAKKCGFHTEGEQVTAIGGLMDLLLGTAKIVAGILGHSSAMFADGLHSLSDAISDIVVILSLKLSAKQATARYAYGFKRIEALGVLFIGVLLGGFAITLALDSVHLLLTPEQQQIPATFAIYVAAVCMVFKEIYFWVSYSVGKRSGSQLLIANAHHSRTDVYTSVLVLAGLFAAQYAYPWLDQVLALFVSGFVIWQAIHFIRTSISELLDENLPDNKRALIEKLVLAIDGVQGIHDLRARKLANDYFLECHLVVQPQLSVSEGHYLGVCAELQIRKIYPEVTQFSIHVDTFSDTGDTGDSNSGHHYTTAQLPSRRDIVLALQNLWHDLLIEPDYDALRIHYREQHIELDVICPFAASLYDGASRSRYERRLFQAVDHFSWLDAVHLYYQADPSSQQLPALDKTINPRQSKRGAKVVYLHQQQRQQC